MGKQQFPYDMAILVTERGLGKLRKVRFDEILIKIDYCLKVFVNWDKDGKQWETF
jgi:hypothetical protein